MIYKMRQNKQKEAGGRTKKDLLCQIDNRIKQRTNCLHIEQQLTVNMQDQSPFLVSNVMSMMITSLRGKRKKSFFIFSLEGGAANFSIEQAEVTILGKIPCSTKIKRPFFKKYLET